jgi:hypothetical protein
MEVADIQMDSAITSKATTLVVRHKSHTLHTPEKQPGLEVIARSGGNNVRWHALRYRAWADISLRLPPWPLRWIWLARRLEHHWVWHALRWMWHALRWMWLELRWMWMLNCACRPDRYCAPIALAQRARVMRQPDRHCAPIALAQRARGMRRPRRLNELDRRRNRRRKRRNELDRRRVMRQLRWRCHIRRQICHLQRWVRRWLRQRWVRRWLRLCGASLSSASPLLRPLIRLSPDDVRRNAINGSTPGLLPSSCLCCSNG